MRVVDVPAVVVVRPIHLTGLSKQARSPPAGLSASQSASQPACQPVYQLSQPARLSANTYYYYIVLELFDSLYKAFSTKKLASEQRTVTFIVKGNSGFRSCDARTLTKYSTHTTPLQG